MQRSERCAASCDLVCGVGSLARRIGVEFDKAAERLADAGITIEYGLEHVARVCLARCDRIGGVGERCGGPVGHRLDPLARDSRAARKFAGSVSKTIGARTVSIAVRSWV